MFCWYPCWAKHMNNIYVTLLVHGVHACLFLWIGWRKVSISPLMNSTPRERERERERWLWVESENNEFRCTIEGFFNNLNVLLMDGTEIY
jgi:hypothetical protein